MNLFANLFTGIGSDSLQRYRNLQKKVGNQFAEVSNLMPSYNIARRKLEIENQKLQNFNTQNAGMEIAKGTVENKVFEKRLKRRKYFTVGADALVSIPATKLVMGETLGVSNLTIPVVLLIGCVFSYLLLQLAIHYRVDDIRGNSTGVTKYWKRHSYIIPLLLVPILSIFLITQNPDNSANFIWVVFLVIAFVLNLKAASYSGAFNMMENTVEAKQAKAFMQKKIDACNELLEGINEKMQKYRAQIELTATEMLDEWLKIPAAERPTEISLSPKYIFVLNNQIYYRQVLPMPSLSISLPQGDVAEFHDFWRSIAGNPINALSNNIIENTNTDNTEPPQLIPNDNDQNFGQTESEDAPTFGNVITDNNKFI